MVEGSNKPLEVCLVSSLLKQGHLQPVVLAHVQVYSGVETPQGNLCQCLVTHTVKKFLDVQQKLFVFQCVPNTSGAVTEH